MSRVCLIMLTAWLAWLQAVVADTITVRWDPPTHNEDGTVLTDLAGHKVFLGTGSGEYTFVTNVGMTLETRLTGLDSDTTYYIAVKSYTTSNIESAYSTEIVSLPLGLSPQPEYLWREAENTALTAPMQAVPDITASGGQFIETTQVYKGTAVYTFSVTGGQYTVWARVAMTWPSPGAHDTVWVRVDDGTYRAWHFFVGEYDEIDEETAWRWDAVPGTYDLSPGPHTITFQGGDTHARLDRILVTSDSAYDPGARTPNQITALRVVN